VPPTVRSPTREVQGKKQRTDIALWGHSGGAKENTRSERQLGKPLCAAGGERRDTMGQRGIKKEGKKKNTGASGSSFLCFLGVPSKARTQDSKAVWGAAKQ